MSDRFDVEKAFEQFCKDRLLHNRDVWRDCWNKAAKFGYDAGRESLRAENERLRNAAQNFWAFIQGEYGVKLSSEDLEDHNVVKFFAALEGNE